MVQIQLEDTVAAALAVRARSRGLSLEEYLAELSASEQATMAPRMSGEEAIRLIEAEAGPGNHQGTYSREDVYIDHD